MKNNIASVRRSKKMTQKELANKTGMHERNIQAIEAEIIAPRVANAMKIAGALGVTVEELFSQSTPS